jgi:hypothetical protein
LDIKYFLSYSLERISAEIKNGQRRLNAQNYSAAYAAYVTYLANNEKPDKRVDVVTFLPFPAAEKEESKIAEMIPGKVRNELELALEKAWFNVKAHSFIYSKLKGG